MRLETISIEENGHAARLDAYLLDESHANPVKPRRSLLIIPGGAYAFVSPREAEPIALKFLSEGFNCFILWYAVAPAVFPVSLRQAAKAMQIIRRRADEWNVDRRAVAVMGFSAGGHLAGSLGILWNEKCVTDVVPAEEARPDAMLLCYPVISSGEHAHKGSFYNLLGERKDDQGMRDALSLEKRVHPAVPPAFIWHTFEDELVPLENSLLIASALRKNGVPFEMHIFPNGAHGLALATEETGNVQARCSEWIALAAKWLKGLDYGG